MKSLFNNTTRETDILNGFSTSHFTTGYSSSSNSIQTGLKNNVNRRSQINLENLLTPNAYFQMVTGQIPELWNICNDLYHILENSNSPVSALQFVPALQKIHSLDANQVKRFLKNPETRQVIVDNRYLKVVLIHWKAGKVSSIHGHPSGGCVFKILQGKLEELRYTPEESPKLLSSNSYRSGSMTYIDDRMGYHQVGNPFGTSAISLHIYTTGKENFNQK